MTLTYDSYPNPNAPFARGRGPLAKDAEPVDVKAIAKQLREALPNQADMDLLIAMLTSPENATMAADDARPAIGLGARRSGSIDTRKAYAEFRAQFPESQKVRRF